jgi:hypothetical protein
VIDWPFRLNVPFTVNVAGFTALPKFTVGVEPLGASTSNVNPGEVVPMPTLTFVPPFMPLIAPRTSALLVLTSAFEPSNAVRPWPRKRNKMPASCAKVAG